MIILKLLLNVSVIISCIVWLSVVPCDIYLAASCRLWFVDTVL